MEQFYFNKYYEALELGDEETAEKILKKLNWITRQGEAKKLAKVLLVIIIFTILSPLIHWWLIGWRYNL